MIYLQVNSKKKIKIIYFFQIKGLLLQKVIFFVNLRKPKIIKMKYYTQKDIFKTLDSNYKAHIKILKDIYLDVIIKEEDTTIIKLQ